MLCLKLALRRCVSNLSYLWIQVVSECLELQFLPQSHDRHPWEMNQNLNCERFDMKRKERRLNEKNAISKIGGRFVKFYFIYRNGLFS